MANPCLQPNSLDFRGYPFVEYTETKSQVFFRNNCPSGQSGSGVTYSKTYTSYVSEQDLQQQIENDISSFNSAGQAQANSQGTCSSSCVASNVIAPHYIPVAFTLSQVLSCGHGVLPTLLSRANYTSPTQLSNINALVNTSGYWHTPYPHSNFGTLRSIDVVESGNTSSYYGVTISTSNPCNTSTRQLIWVEPQSGGYSLMSTCLPNGMFFIVIGNGGRSIALKWWLYGSTVMDIAFFNSPNGESHYVHNGVSMIYNGSNSLYLMVGFRSPNNDRRTRTGFFRVVLSGGVPTGQVDMIQNYSYSNQNLSRISGVHAGSRIFFMYLEGRGSSRGWRFYPLEGAAPAPLSTDIIWDVFRFIRDPQNTNIAYGANNRRLVRYDSSANTWTLLKS